MNGRALEMIKMCLGHQAFENIILAAKLEEAGKQIVDLQKKGEPEVKEVPGES